MTEDPQNVSYDDAQLSISASPYEVVRIEFADTTLAQPVDSAPIWAIDRVLEDEEMGIAADDNINEELDEMAELVAESMGAAGIALFLPLLILL